MTWEVCQNPINKFKHHPAKVLVYAVLVFGMRHSILSLGSGVACNFRHVVSEKKCSSGRPSRSETILINFSTKLHPDPNYQAPGFFVWQPGHLGKAAKRFAANIGDGAMG